MFFFFSTRIKKIINRSKIKFKKKNCEQDGDQEVTSFAPDQSFLQSAVLLLQLFDVITGRSAVRT